MADKIITSMGDCTFCCSGTGCACALLLGAGGTPGTDAVTPYASYAAAFADVNTYSAGTSNGIVKDCFAWFKIGPSGTPTATASFASNTASIAGITDVMDCWFSCSLKAGDTVTFAVVGGSGFGYPFTVYSCEDLSTGIFGGFVVNGTNTTWTVPADGEYVINPFVSSGADYDGAWTIGSSGAMVVNPVIALWDDSGTTRQLEACPRTLAPMGTEQSGDWFADATEAADFFSSTGSEQVVDCLGILDFSWSGGSLSAKAATGGSTPSISSEIATASIADSANIQLYRGVMITGGDTITVNIGLLGSSGGAGIDVRSILEVIDPLTGSVEFSDTQSAGGDSLSISPTFAAPWTGKFYLKLRARYRASGPAAGDFQASMDVSSSGAMSGDVPVQALYDTGLDCPARFDCP